jgi:hypothetical protein
MGANVGSGEEAGVALDVSFGLSLEMVGSAIAAAGVRATTQRIDQCHIHV